MRHMTPILHRHFCGFDWCDGNVPAKVNPYCWTTSDTAYFGDEQPARCARIDGHTGPHRAFTFSVNTPHEWS